MTRAGLLTTAITLMLTASATAQASGELSAGVPSMGGLAVTGPGMGPMPLQPELPLGAPLHQTPSDIRAANPARAREAAHQSSIAAIRGDAGFLAGFFHGQPLAASRQPPPDFAMPDFVTIIQAPFTQNNYGSPVAVNTNGAPATINAKDSPVAVNSGPGKVEQNINSAVNIAAGTGNVAVQKVATR